MSRKYVRKVGVQSRGVWTEDALKSAFEGMNENKYFLNEISRRYGIPCRTLKRRFAKQDTKKLTLGKHPVLDFDNEKRLVAHVQKLEAVGFPVTRDVIRRLAFEFAEKLSIKHNFDQETRKAGPHWLQSFLERNSELSVRQAEGLSLARAQGLKKRPRASSEETCASDDSLIESNTSVIKENKIEQKAKKLRLSRRNQKRSVNNTQNIFQSSVHNVNNESNSTEDATNKCVECFNNFETTKSKVDWIQCVMCRNFLHETCTMYGDYCNQCMRLKLRQEKKNN